MWRDWSEGIWCLNYLIFVRWLTDRSPVDFGSDDDDDNDDEGTQAEDGLVLAFRKEDRYPLLPEFNSNPPLDVLKRILRVYVREV